MAVLRGKRISERTVDALPVDGKDALYWDPDLKGFGVRVYASGSKVLSYNPGRGGNSSESRWAPTA